MNDEYQRLDFWNRELKEQRKDFIERIADTNIVLDKADGIESAYAEDTLEAKKDAQVCCQFEKFPYICIVNMRDKDKKIKKTTITLGNMIEIVLWVAMILGVYTLRQAAGKIEELEHQVKQQDQRIKELQLMVESLVLRDSANDPNT